MLKIRHHIFFKKDFKKLVKNGFDLKLLYKVVGNLAKEQPLEIQRPPTQRRFKRF